MEETLQNKKILFLCPLFFNYHKKIMKAMESLGAQVDYYDERPSNTVASKALLRINRNFVKGQIKNHYETITADIKDKKYDFVFICQAEATPIWFLQDVRKMNPKSRIVAMSFCEPRSCIGRLSS